MDPRLKGSSIPTPSVQAHPLNSSLRNQPGFQEIQTFYPGFEVLCSIKRAPEEDLWFDHTYRIASVLSRKNLKSSGPVSLRVERNTSESGVEVHDISGFCKLTHLLDPVRWLQGKYSIPKHPFLPWHQESWEAAWKKLHDPMNQAYVEAVAAYAFSRLREADYSPHFHLFYGAMCSSADTYAYNITDSYMSYRHARWFWNAKEKALFEIGFDDTIPPEVKEALLEQPEELDSSSDEDTEASAEELEGLECDEFEANSLHSASGSAFNSASEEEDSDESEDHSDDSEELEIYANIQKFPVMMIFTEASEGTMDDLLDNFEEVGSKPGSAEWELTWKAWIFQIIAALSAAQSIFGFTHNDLHSNNVVWTHTSKPYLYYKTRDGLQFQVPTFGKLFRIIDFGRSIFKINDKEFFSDDFREGNDAAEQFNFGELFNPNEPEVHPNPSFDLSRFTVSIFESLFPESPPITKGKRILSQEPDLTVYETESDLYNLLWSWLLCDDGHNVLIDPDGSERYPDFDLYKVITQQVHGAVPCEQVRKPVFSCFQTHTIPTEKVYSLFC